jgi:uncharacterized protein YxjI
MDAPWVEGAGWLPGWIKETELHVRALMTLTDTQGKRIERLEEDLQVVKECFERVARQG